MRPDISVLDSDGRAVLIVEVKNRAATSPEWAVEFRRNVLAKYLGPPPPFFLLATPDRFYFWKKRSGRSRLVEPDFVVEPNSFLKPYYPTGAARANPLSEYALEFVVGNWLRSLTHNGTGEGDSTRWLSASGLLEAIHGGRVVLEPEA
jgi:hypothetical protein